MDKRSKNKGGARTGAGRPRRTNNVVQLTTFLRKDTIEQLRKAAGSKYVGGVLQEHLDMYPIQPQTSQVAVSRPVGRPRLSQEERERRRQARLAPTNKLERTYFKLLKQEQRAQAKAAAKKAKKAKA